MSLRSLVHVNAIQLSISPCCNIQLAKTSRTRSTASPDLAKNISSRLAACVAEVRTNSNSGSRRRTLHIALVRCACPFSRPLHDSAISTIPGLPTLTLASSTHGRVRKATRKVTEYAEASLTVQSQKEQQAAWKSSRLRKEAGRIQ